MKEIFTDTLELDKFLVNDLFLKKEHKLNKPIRVAHKLKLWKSSLFENEILTKDPKEFSSLERIRVVVDSLLGDESIREICLKEKISQKTFYQWKSDFIDAFNKHSEDHLIQEKLKVAPKELILKDININACNFYEQFINIYSDKNLVIPKGEKLSTYSSFNNIQNVIILTKINNFRQINKHLEEVNSKLEIGGVLLGNFETFKARAKKKMVYKIPIVREVYFGLEFIFNRVFPKLPYVKNLYFTLTKGKNRLLSKTEALGRLVSCGFEILDFKNIDGINYFAVRKATEPAYDMNPSYGPLFKMKRVGKNGNIIGVYKLRTMHPYSEYLQEYIYNKNGSSNGDKINNDFRVTPWGKIIRKLWLDELPMLLNLLNGSVKLVGVRPLSVTKYNLYSEELKQLRIKSKPGLLPPFYADMPTSFEELMESEKRYLDQYFRSPFLTDLKYLKLIFVNIFINGKRSA